MIALNHSIRNQQGNSPLGVPSGEAPDLEAAEPTVGKLPALKMNPAHEEHLKYEMLRMRSACNMQFGDATVLSGTIERKNSIETPFVPVEVTIPVLRPETLLGLAALPRDHPSRIRLDRELYGEIEKLHQAFAAQQ